MRQEQVKKSHKKRSYPLPLPEVDIRRPNIRPLPDVSPIIRRIDSLLKQV